MQNLLVISKDDHIVHVSHVIFCSELFLDKVIKLLQIPVGEPLRGVEPQGYALVGHIDKLVQQMKHLVIMDQSRQFLFKNIVWYAIEEVVNVHFQYIFRILRVIANPLLDSFLSSMGSPARYTCITMLIHAFPKDRLQSIHNAMLDNKFLHSWNDYCTNFSGDTIVNHDRRMLSILEVHDPII